VEEQDKDRKRAGKNFFRKQRQISNRVRNKVNKQPLQLISVRATRQNSMQGTIMQGANERETRQKNMLQEISVQEARKQDTLQSTKRTANKPSREKVTRTTM
jgi:hypothetical protein